MINNVNRIYKVIKKFENEKDSKTKAVLFNPNTMNNYYRLMISSECLDKLNPYDSTLEVIKYIKSNDPEIVKDLFLAITPVHTDDETMKILNLNYKKGVSYIDKLEMFDKTLSEVYVMI